MVEGDADAQLEAALAENALETREAERLRREEEAQDEEALRRVLELSAREGESS